jgi:Cd2+/Zn2+-exporting ATPase
VIDELFLMTIASAGALIIGQPAEAVGVMLFYAIGESLRERAVAKSRSAIHGAMSLRDGVARVVDGAAIREVDPATVSAGTLVEVLPGDYVSLDGIVESGESWMDTSAMTGESEPRRFSEGDEILAGYVNDEGRLRVRVNRPHTDSAVSRVKRLLEQASERKSPTERIFARFAAVYTPAVVALAVLLAVGLPLVTELSIAESAYRAMILLVISCPCALVVSIPLSYFAGIGRASRQRTLLHGSDVLDALTRVKTVVFDKTGTLTEGRFSVQHVVPADGWSDQQLLSVAASALKESRHPLAKSVVARATAAGVDYGDIAWESVHETKGRGVRVERGHETVCAGSAALLAANGVTAAEPDGDGSVVHVARNGEYAGHLLLNDSTKDGAAALASALRDRGVNRFALLTGDRRERAERLGSAIGINDVHAELLPEDKMTALESIMENETGEKTKVAFVGDGMNDAPVIIRSNVGMAMGRSGTDLAIESADVVFMDDRLSRIPELFDTAALTRRIVIQNIIFALGMKLAFMAFGVEGSLPMWGAVVGDVGVALVAVLNTLRILRSGDA